MSCCGSDSRWPHGSFPLLLVAGVPNTWIRPATWPRSERGVRTRAGVVFELARALADGDITELLGMKLGARPGDSLQPVVRQAGGNPLYAIALASDLTRRDAVRVENGVAEADERVPLSPEVSLLAAVDRSLNDTLSPDALDVLRTAAPLGAEFTVAELGGVGADAGQSGSGTWRRPPGRACGWTAAGTCLPAPVPAPVALRSGCQKTIGPNGTGTRLDRSTRTGAR